MKYTEFKNGLENGKKFSVYLFEGEDAFFKERGFNLLKNKFITQPELNLTALSSDCSYEELLSSVGSYPFMSECRMTVLKEFYPKQDFIKNIKDYLNNPFDFSLLVILNEKPCEAVKKFDTVCVVDCGKADSALLVRWIKGECGNSGVQIQAETAKVIADYCLSDMTRIENETKKLCAYVGDGGVITKTEVDLMVTRDSEYKIYEMTDYISKRKFDMALTVIKEMMSKGETSQRILSSVYNYFRRMLHASISDFTLEELATAFGIKEYACKKIKEQANMFKKRSLKSAVDALTDADYKIKSGQADADDKMWLTLFQIMMDN